MSEHDEREVSVSSTFKLTISTALSVSPQEVDEKKAFEKLYLGVPQNEAIEAAAGRVALRHAQLEHILRMTVKSIRRATVNETHAQLWYCGARQLRGLIAKEFRKRVSDASARRAMRELLEETRQASNARNGLVHAVWFTDSEGNLYLQATTDMIEAPPPLEQWVNTEQAIFAVTKKLNHERLHGFIKDALEAAAKSAP